MNLPFPHSRRWRVAGALALVAVLASGCSIGAEQSPNVVAPQNVPSGLTGSGPPTPTATVPSENVTIYLEGLQRLVTVNREVARPAAPGAVLAALGKGSTGAEAAQNLRSPISAAVPLSVVSLTNARISIEVSSSFTNLTGGDEVAAAAQLVYTMTALPDIHEVSVEIGHRSVSMPLPDGRLSSGPLTRSDYASLAPV